MTQLTRCLEAVSPDSDCNLLVCDNCMNIVSKVQEKDDSQEDDSQERKRARSSRRSTKGHNYKFLDSSALSQTKSSKSKPKCSHCKNGSDCAVKYTREQAIRELLVNGASHLKNDTLSDLRRTGYYRSSAQDDPNQASKCVLCMPNKGSCYLWWSRWPGFVMCIRRLSDCMH